MVGTRQKGLIFLLALLAVQPLRAQSGTERRDSLVRLMKATSVSLVEEFGETYRKAFDATFLHNGTYLICDTALWDVGNKVINAKGNVQVIQDETILTSETLDYLIDENLAKFRGGVVQLQNKKLNTLRTRHLDYNTKDSVAVFHNGASMKDQDGQIIESKDGEYDSARKVFTFSHNVNMFTDSVFVKTELMEYDSDASRADFLTYIDFWKEGNMLSADRGWYDRRAETFFFKDNVHGLGKTQEVWSDTMYFYRNVRELEMMGNVQIQDTSRNSATLSGYVLYQDTISTVTLTRDAAVALFTEEDSRKDTLYAGADRMVYRAVKKCDILPSDMDAAMARRKEMSVDPVAEYRAKAAQAAKEAAEKAAEEAAKNDPALAAQMKAQKMAQNAADTSPVASAEDTPSLPGPVAGDGTVLPSDTSATAATDTVAAAPDTSKLGFVICTGNVKIFRKDIQARCDSLLYTDIDSIARMFLDPMVWNDGNRQYNADSIYVMVKDGGVEKASLLSNAFIMVQEDSSAFDQIRGAEVMAYFDSTTALRRFDALGGASALFFLNEDDELVTVNKVASKMLTANLKNGEVERVYYFEEPKNDALPRAQLSGQDSRMKGFNWQPGLKPGGKADITPLVLRPAERKRYEARPHATFRETDYYFPGYMKGVYRELEVKDSLKRLPPQERPAVVADTAVLAVDSFPAPDTSSVNVEVDSSSVHAAIDSVALDALEDTSAFHAVADSSAAVVPADSAVAVEAISRKDSLRVARQSEREAKAALASARRAEALAAKEARWARLDSLDSLKFAARQFKLLEKKREKTRRAVILKMKQDSRDQAKLDKYIKQYEKRKARSESRQSKRGNRVLSDDGPHNDSDIFRGGGVSRAQGGPGI